MSMASTLLCWFVASTFFAFVMYFGASRRQTSRISVAFIKQRNEMIRMSGRAHLIVLWILHVQG